MDDKWFMVTKKQFILFFIVSILLAVIGIIFHINLTLENKVDSYCKLSGYGDFTIKQESNFPKFGQFPYFQRDYFCVVNEGDTYNSIGAKYIQNIKKVMRNEKSKSKIF
jgi:hypothetical protein